MTVNNYMVIFDLDDTLYKEVDFLKSAYLEISNYIESQFGYHGIIYKTMLDLYAKGEDVFKELIWRFELPLKKEDLLFMYRTHFPDISLSPETRQTLEILSELHPIGLITDGRAVTQRNKINVLGLMSYIKEEKNIVISEEFKSAKPSVCNYRYFHDLYPAKQFIYVGDNVEKDFIAPNSLHWVTVCLLDDGRNIHKQDFGREDEYLPTYKVNNISSILGIVCNI